MAHQHKEYTFCSYRLMDGDDTENFDKMEEILSWPFDGRVLNRKKIGQFLYDIEESCKSDPAYHVATVYDSDEDTSYILLLRSAVVEEQEASEAASEEPQQSELEGWEEDFPLQNESLPGEEEGDLDAATQEEEEVFPQEEAQEPFGRSE